ERIPRSRLPLQHLAIPWSTCPMRGPSLPGTPSAFPMKLFLLKLTIQVSALPTMRSSFRLRVGRPSFRSLRAFSVLVGYHPKSGILSFACLLDFCSIPVVERRKNRLVPPSRSCGRCRPRRTITLSSSPVVTYLLKSALHSSRFFSGPAPRVTLLP